MIDAVGAVSSRELDLLDVCARKIVPSDFNSLRGAGGFDPPNDFSLSRLVDPLRARRFPRDRFYDYQWALFECGYEAVAALDDWPRAYLCALFLYCSRKSERRLDVDTDYCHLILRSSIGRPESASFRWFRDFLAWLVKCFPSGEGRSSYVLILSWVFLQRLDKGFLDSADPTVRQAMEFLQDHRSELEGDEWIGAGVCGLDEWLKLVDDLCGDDENESSAQLWRLLGL